MALLGQFTKQPREILSCDISYIPALEQGDSLTTIDTPEVTPSGGGAVTISGQTVYDGNKVKFKVSGGTDSIPYTITILVNTTNGLKFEDEIQVLVEEVS